MAGFAAFGLIPVASKAYPPLRLVVTESERKLLAFPDPLTRCVSAMQACVASVSRHMDLAYHDWRAGITARIARHDAQSVAPAHRIWSPLRAHAEMVSVKQTILVILRRNVF